MLLERSHRLLHRRLWRGRREPLFDVPKDIALDVRAERGDVARGHRRRNGSGLRAVERYGDNDRRWSGERRRGRDRARRSLERPRLGGGRRGRASVVDGFGGLGPNRRIVADGDRNDLGAVRSPWRGDLAGPLEPGGDLPRTGGFARAEGGGGGQRVEELAVGLGRVTRHEARLQVLLHTFRRLDVHRHMAPTGVLQEQPGALHGRSDPPHLLAPVASALVLRIEQLLRAPARLHEVDALDDGTELRRGMVPNCTGGPGAGSPCPGPKCWSGPG